MVKYSHRYRVDIFLVVLDSLLFEMDERFSETSTNLLKYIVCLDPRNFFSKFDHDKFLELASIYSTDFSSVDRTFLRGELSTFIYDVRNSSEFSDCHDLATFAIQMVQTKIYLCFPLVYRLIELTLILHVATTTVERTFSAMNIIKTELRNKMGGEWMNDNMICYIERGIFTTIDDKRILQFFQNMKTRRM
jgi:hAT family C-terminal dimerisation region